MSRENPGFIFRREEHEQRKAEIKDRIRNIDTILESKGIPDPDDLSERVEIERFNEEKRRIQGELDGLEKLG